MSNPAKKSVDLIANWQREAMQFRAESEGAKARNSVIDQEIANLALPFKQGNPDAIARVKDLRTERAANLDLIELNEPAVRKLEALASAELTAEQARSDRHLRRKADKVIQTMPAAAKDLDRGIKLVVQSYASILATAEQPRISWRSNWPAMPGILLERVICRALSHSLHMAFREANIKPIEPRYSEDVAQYKGLHHYFSTKAIEAKHRLLGDGAAVIVEDPIPDDEPSPATPTSAMPVRLQEQPHVYSDEEIARANADGTAQNMGWPISGREYVKARDHGKEKEPQFAPDIDPFTGQEI